MKKADTRFWGIVLALLTGLGLVAVFVPQREARADDYRPVRRHWEVAAPGANTDAVADLTWDRRGPLRISLQVDTASVVNVMVSRDGTENALGLNSSSQLVAGSLYTFDVHGIQPGDIINVQPETDTAFPLIEFGTVQPGR